jgi:hypothetical protein
VALIARGIMNPKEMEGKRKAYEMNASESRDDALITE